MDLMNEIMKKTLEASKPIKNLNPALSKIIDNGIIVTASGGFFLSERSTPKVLEQSAELYGDMLSDYENLINKIHIDDYCDEFVFEESFYFLDSFTKKWMELFPKTKCLISLSFQDDDDMGKMAAFSFRIERRQAWFGEEINIEDFQQPILIRYLNYKEPT